MSILANSIWIWFGIALMIAVVGGALYSSNRSLKTLGITAVLTLAVLGIGLLVYHFCDTDYKSVSRMLTALASAIEKDDLDGVKKFISPKAMNTRIKAENNMRIVKVSSANFFDLSVDANHMTHPPTAQVKFVAVVRFQSKGSSIFGEYQGTQRVLFDVELEKTKDSWFITDKCNFKPNATGFGN